MKRAWASAARLPAATAASIASRHAVTASRDRPCAWRTAPYQAMSRARAWAASCSSMPSSGLVALAHDPDRLRVAPVALRDQRLLQEEAGLADRVAGARLAGAAVRGERAVVEAGALPDVAERLPDLGDLGRLQLGHAAVPR